MSEAIQSKLIPINKVQYYFYHAKVIVAYSVLAIIFGFIHLVIIYFIGLSIYQTTSFQELARTILVTAFSLFVGIIPLLITCLPYIVLNSYFHYKKPANLISNGFFHNIKNLEEIELDRIIRIYQHKDYFLIVYVSTDLKRILKEKIEFDFFESPHVVINDGDISSINMQDLELLKGKYPDIQDLEKTIQALSHPPDSLINVLGEIVIFVILLAFSLLIHLWPFLVTGYLLKYVFGCLRGR